VGGTIYSWTTDDGDVAFTDDPKSIPERYRDQVRTRKSQPLADYERMTAQDPASTARYQEQLANRVLYLRAFNEAASQAPTYIDETVGQVQIDVGGVTLDVAAGYSPDPIIVESVRVRASGQIASRHDTVVRQGGRSLAIIRGRQEGELGGVSGVLDEEDLELYE
jgi:hypothetical protein